MKRNRALIIAVCWLMVGCYQADEKDVVKDFIPGTYTTMLMTSYNESSDTLVIESSKESGVQNYIVTRRMRTSYKTDAGKRSSYKIINWAGSYDAITKTVLIKQSGKILSFDLTNKQMKIGNIIYQKL